jgi:RimJ/RimL family protein N-acetyltransferase
MTIDLGEIHLCGREVLLRPLASTDAEALRVAASESRQTYDYATVPSNDDAQGYVEQALKMRAAGLRYPFVIVWNDRVVGSTSYYEYQPWKWPPAGAHMQRTDRPDATEIGYTWLAASAQRTRCNTETKFLLLQHAFETWQVHRVMLRTDERNSRSRAAIERLGCKLDGIKRADMPGRDGTIRNSALYSILASEWPAVKDRLKSDCAPNRFRRKCRGI